jgi:hypothetical protein
MIDCRALANNLVRDRMSAILTGAPPAALAAKAAARPDRFVNGKARLRPRRPRLWGHLAGRRIDTSRRRLGR